MKKDTTCAVSGQGSAQQAEVLSRMCYRYVRPLLKRLHEKLDRRLVQTFLVLMKMIVMHRHRNHGLLLSELGRYLMGAGQAPAGTKRISNLLRNQRWAQ